MPDPRNRYRWNATARQYIDASGRFVTRREVRTALDRAIANEAKVMQEALNALRGSGISLERWVLQMRTSIKNVHLWSAAAAKGGWAQLDQSDYGRVGNIVLAHYRRLQEFAQQIAAGLALDGRATHRVSMYANSGRRTYHAIEEIGMKAAGFTQEVNILNPLAEHCDECAALTERGWVPIGSLPRIGSRECLTGCACWIDYA